MSAVATVLSVLCCANFALASQTTPSVSSNTAAIGIAPVGNDLALIDIGGCLRFVGGFLRSGISGPSSGGSSSNNVVCQGSNGNLGITDAYGTTWHDLCIGAGGYLSGIDIAPDGTKVIRTDTYGAYLWNGTQWDQLVSTSSMPASFLAGVNNGTYQASFGVYEIRIAPSNSSIFYMMYDGFVFKSVNKGTTWTQTTFTQLSSAQIGSMTGDSYRGWGQKIAIDPNNPSVVYVGTPRDGLFLTTDGGNTWSSVSGVPAGTSDGNGNYPGITGIAFAPALGTTGGNTNTIFAASYGNGVYESTNAGVSWSLIAGSATSVPFGVVSGSTYYFTDGTNLWSYASGTLTKLLAGSAGNDACLTVAVNPFNTSEIVVQNGGGSMDVSYNSGSSWTGWNSDTNINSTDIPWLSSGPDYISVGGTVFDPQVNGKLWVSEGTGVIYTTILTTGFNSNPITFTDQSLGIEQLVANTVIAPPGGNPVVGVWDRGFFATGDLDQFPSSYGPDYGSFVAGWSLDYASSNPGFLVGLADWWGTEESGYSTNGGQTWTAFPTFIPGADSSFMGGTIAASSPTNIIWAPADNYGPYYTLNGGVTWNAITLPGVSGWNNFDPAYYDDQILVTADRVLANTFYLWYPSVGVFVSTSSGATWMEVDPTSAPSGEAEIQAVPGEAQTLFLTGGYTTTGFWKSTNGGVTFTAVPNVNEVSCFGYGAPAPGTTTPAIYIDGEVNNVTGIWQSINDGNSWTQIGSWPLNILDYIKTISGDMNAYGRVYVGFPGEGYAYGDTANAQIPPILSSIASSSVTTSSATITWTTDQSSNSEVVYGVTSSYGSSASNASFATLHSINLTGLTSSTQYHFAVVSSDAQSYVATSTDYTFSTL